MPKPMMLPILVALSIPLGGAAHADTWTTVDDYSVAGVDVQPTAIAADSTYIYVAGTDGTHAVVRRRAFNGTGFGTVDSFIIPGGDHATATAIAYDSNHNRIFVAGSGTNAADVAALGSSHHWWVRVHDSTGWSTTHVGTQFATSEVNDVGGLVYSTVADKLLVNLSAYGIDSEGVFHNPEWVTKVSSESNATGFTDLGTFSGTGNNNQAHAGPVGFDGNGNVVSLGFLLTTGFTGAEVKLHSGGVWSDFDNQPGALYPSDWMRLGGDYYYSSYSFIGNQWTIRKNPGSTGVWSTVDQINNSNGAAAMAMATYNGILYAAGWNGFAWLVRKSSTGNAGSWTASESYGATHGAGATAMCVADGKIWVAGREYDSTNHLHWVVRVLSP